ncbi:receptor-like protein kinase [Dorcoceras hygrometricum]|uniref:Receptor-like protein kinase n=1 Tax=Dorcoceras hygrometricum TaxID=472368 RepID=A0A2Z7BHU6_9LAMI|nr:receptor-like protein kinase [Dorcoceras hygrometricum]
MAQSNIGPKTPRAARDRPEANPRSQKQCRNTASGSSDGDRTAAPAVCTAYGTLPHAARATVRDIRARWPVIGTVAARSYSATVRTLQCRRVFFSKNL